ncbi:fimbria/pilus outer membrane usher protein (plasmid) [Yersinia sp. HM-2024]|uniref:fimbria/pilus outer membrane usher protein n=1 Tax=Yersinia sp. HM-2024 TaxID=3344550 RepID=UPI00370D28D7
MNLKAKVSRCLFNKENVAIVMLLSFFCHAKEYKFNPDLLGEHSGSVDMTLFNKGNQPPGTYYVDIFVNGEQVDSRDIIFSLKKDSEGRMGLEPCLSVNSLYKYGIRVEDYPALLSEMECANLADIPELKSYFQFTSQRLLLSVPQASLRSKSKGIAPEVLWDDGIPVFLINYRANTNRTEQRNGMKENGYSSSLQLDPGLNVGGWRIRNTTNWNKTNGSSGEWQTVSSYAERGINSIKSRVILGDDMTAGEIFDGVPFRGVRLGSDDNMVPFYKNAFAPVIRGIARTQARIEVKQSGFTIYNNTVAPGPFALTDLSLQGASGGSLQVTIHESDGTVQLFTVPFQTPAIALKEGYLNYSMAAGRYRSAVAGVSHDSFVQATAMYGLPWDLTVYSGVQSAEHFQAGSLGLGKSMGNLGAVSLGTIRSRGQRRYQDTEAGSVWRAIYSKDVLSTNTSIALSRYQFASAKYNTLSEVLDSWQNNPDNNRFLQNNLDRVKSQTSLSLNQSFGEWGYLSLVGNQYEYWGGGPRNEDFNISYGINVSDISLSLGWGQSKQIDVLGRKQTNRQTNIWVSMPLSQWLGGNANTTYQMTFSDRQGNSQEVGLNGRSIGRQLSWDIRQRYRSGPSSGHQSSSSVNLNWMGRYGELGGDYSYSPDQRQMGARVSGGLMLHPYGMTASQLIGDTSALVIAPGASGVSVGGWPGVKTDFRGYTTSSYLNPYQENTVSLDPRFLPENVDVIQTDKKTVPTKGAVVVARFPTRVGGRAMMTLTKADGKIPFGSVVTVEGGTGHAGIVDDKNRVYLTGLPEKGTLLAQWSGGQCKAKYRLVGKPEEAGMIKLSAQCH